MLLKVLICKYGKNKNLSLHVSELIKEQPCDCRQSWS